VSGITTVTAGDTTLALAVTPTVAGQTVYARYRKPGDAWSAESGTFSVVGAGTITITGLTNGQVYEVIVYDYDEVAPGTPMNDWSTPGFGVPDDGLNTPTGVLAKAIDLMRDMLAASSSFQALTGSVDAAEAKTYTYYCVLPHVTGEAYNDTVIAARPYIVVAPGDGYTQNRVANGIRTRLTTGGTILLYVETAIPTAYATDELMDEAYLWFLNELDGILADVQEQSGTGGKLNITEIVGMGWPERAEAKVVHEVGDHFKALYEVTFGI
jgi:hypothetical protein